MIRPGDEWVEALLRGEHPEGIPDADFVPLHEGITALDAAARVEDTLYLGRRVLRTVSRRRRRYYLDVGCAQWITFEWRVHDAINVRLVRLRRTTLGPAFRR